ncbi:hypothetical protein RGT17_02935 [Bacillus altitudinis]|uniref:hypothetical protein n=1 Tax=Bacillus pumilus TaxID=1408 RepID=UPI0025A240F2|nr:hypothetical protein [Bacillus pumilus]MDM5319164.1 hypothetical protein [Bacillus pumilus]MDR4994194.1 hypothetical protein [Bacillus altitudinis]
MLHEIILLSIIHESVKRIEVKGLKSRDFLADVPKLFKRFMFFENPSQLGAPNK